MMDRLSRSIRLMKASLAVVRADRELLLFPILSGIATMLVAASFLLPAFALGAFERLGQSEHPEPVWYVVSFAFYLVQYFVIYFFNSALVGAALIRLEGGDPTLRDGLRIATRHWISILGYAALSATVGLLLRMLQQRSGAIGRWVTGLLGLAWTVGTYLAIPVLVARGAGPLDAVRESTRLLRQTWGENLAGRAGLGLAFLALHLGVGLIAAGLIAAAIHFGWVMLVIVLVITALLIGMALALLQATLQGVYAAALYQYAQGNGSAAAGLAGMDLSHAFQPRS